MEAFYEDDFLHCRIGIFPSFRFVWQLFVKDRKRQRNDTDTCGISIFRQQ